MSEMYATRRLEKSERLQAEVDKLQNQIDLMKAVISLASHPLWKEYKRTLDARVTVMANKCVVAPEEGVSLERHDRERAEAAAVARELHMLSTAPQRSSVAVPALEEQIQQMQAQINDIESTYGFARKGASNA